jgi:hypothetical protein
MENGGLLMQSSKRVLQDIGTWEDPGDPDLRRLVDPEWDDDEADMVARYFRNGMRLGASLGGPARCRMCDFKIPDDWLMTDGTYQWRELLAHYVEVHKVRMPRAIVEWIDSNLASLEEDAIHADDWWQENAFMDLEASPDKRRPVNPD